MIVKRKLFAKKHIMKTYDYVDKYLKNATEKAGYSYMPGSKNISTNINGFAITPATTGSVDRLGIVGRMPHESIDDFFERISKPTNKIDKILNDAKNAGKLRSKRIDKVNELKHQRVVGKRLKKLGKEL